MLTLAYAVPSGFRKQADVVADLTALPLDQSILTLLSMVVSSDTTAPSGTGAQRTIVLDRGPNYVRDYPHSTSISSVAAVTGIYLDQISKAMCADATEHITGSL